MHSRNPRSTRRVRNAPASASESRAPTRMPFSPVRTTSRHPGTSVATIGRPLAQASSRAFGKPSRYDGRQTMCAADRTRSMSFRWPQCSTTLSRSHPLSAFSDTELGFSGSLAPTRANRAANPSARSMRAAATNSSTPLSLNSLPGSTTTQGGPSGGAVTTKRSTSTPEPRITTMASEATPNSRITRPRSSGFCTITRCATPRNPPLSNRRTSMRRARTPGARPVKR